MILTMTNATQEQEQKSTVKNTLGIRGFDYVEFYVGSATMMTYWFTKAMGFDVTAFSGPEHGTKDRISFFMKQNKIKVVVTSAIQPDTSEVQDFVKLHGEGVKRIAYEVDDVNKAYSFAVEKGGIELRKPSKIEADTKAEEDSEGFIEEAAIKVYDDTEIVFINYDNYKGSFKPGFGGGVQNYQVERKNPDLLFIDHIVGNVRENEMDKWADYFNKCLDFETYVHFGPGDISTKYSALLSKVVRSKDNIIKNPINEPFDGLKKSQIEEYIDQYKGSGIQHIAIATGDIIKAIAHLRANGVEFLEVPDTYYDELRKNAGDRVDENIDDLQKHGILCDLDKDGRGYLLQLFTKPIGDRPTFFFEIIQRRYGSESFGQGNFQALFESIERDQEKRGNW